MKTGWRIGSLFGIPILIAPSWFIILAVVTYAYGSAWQSTPWIEPVVWGAAIAMALCLFLSVVLHELGHSLVARFYEIPVQSITLFLFGGVATISQESKTPGQSLQVAIAGPLVSFLLYALLTLVELLLPNGSPGRTVVANLAGINLILAVFNMIPGLPLDGGQVLKSTIWKLTGSRIAGVRWAARAGWFVGGMAIALSLFWVATRGMISMLWVAWLGWFGLRHASAHHQFASLQAMLLRLTAGQAISREFITLEADQSLQQFADRYLAIGQSPPSCCFVARQGVYQGLLLPESLTAWPCSDWPHLTVSAASHPIETLPMIADTCCLADAIVLLEEQELPWLVVQSPTGAIAGLLDRGDIVRAIAKALKQPIDDAVVQQIKDDQAYPDELPLGAIAHTAQIR
jgi:Zn-dependent protease